MSELPQGWVETTLGDLFDVTSSKRVHQHEWTKEGVPFYRAREIKKLARDGFVKNDLFISEELFQKYSSQFGAPVSGDLMVTAVGTLGECYQVREGDRFYFKDASVLWLRKQAEVESDYVAKLFLTEPVLDQVHEGGGTTVGTYTVAAAKATVLPLPPLPEQRRIVAKIDSLTGKSRRARDHLDHIPRLVEKYKQAVLAAAFRGDLTREWRLAHGLPEPHSVQLGNVAEGFNYGSAAKSVKEGGVPVLRMGNIQNGKLDWADLVFTNDAAEISKYRLVPGDVLFNRTNSPALVGKTALYDSDRVAIYAGYLIKVRCKPELLPTFLTYCLNSPMGRAYSWAVKSDGVSQSNINAKKLAAFSFDLPSPQEQAEIVRRIETAFIWIDRLASEATSARRLIDRLDQTVLAKAFRGELVPQDLDDEPASILLERIRAEHGAAPKAKRGRKT